MQDVYISAAKRSPVGNLLGSLSAISVVNLGASVIKQMLAQENLDPAVIQKAIIGQVLTAGLGQNPARQTAIAAGLSISAPSYLVNQVCGSGLQSVMIAANAIASKAKDLVLAGGQESMSNAFHCAYLRPGVKAGDMNLIDTMMYDGLMDAFSKKAMGVTAENIATKYNISRDAQDQFAYDSQQKASNAQKTGRFDAQIVPIELQNKRQSITVRQDEFIKPDTKLEVLSLLKPAFMVNGTVTAGNSSGINDGAAFVLLSSEQALKQHNLRPMARIVSFADCGVEPELMGTGPIPASQMALAKAGWRVDDLDLIECNEAFAAQSICVIQQLGLDPAKVNCSGGAIAIGHPIGASGARCLVTLLHQMRARCAKRGLVTLCVGGGIGVAMCVELV